MGQYHRSALAHLLDVTLQTSPLALAHVLDATLQTSSLALAHLLDATLETSSRAPAHTYLMPRYWMFTFLCTYLMLRSTMLSCTYVVDAMLEEFAVTAKAAS